MSKLASWKNKFTKFNDKTNFNCMDSSKDLPKSMQMTYLKWKIVSNVSFKPWKFNESNFNSSSPKKIKFSSLNIKNLKESKPTTLIVSSKESLESSNSWTESKLVNKWMTKKSKTSTSPSTKSNLKNNSCLPSTRLTLDFSIIKSPSKQLLINPKTNK